MNYSYIREIRITPQMAKEIIEKSERLGFKNRKLSKLIVSRYANAMKKGLWQLSNDVIVITAEGKLINGQHRLHAIIMSGTTQSFFVLENASEDMFKYIDTGKTRSLNDYVRSAGLTESTPCISASAFFILNMFQKGAFYISDHRSHATYSYEQIVSDFIARHYELFLRAEASQKKQRNGSPIPTRSYIVCYVLFSSVNESLAEDFFDILKTKRWGNSKTFPALFNAFQRIPKNIRSEPKNVLVTKYLFAAWDAFINGKELQRIKTTPDNTLPPLAGFDAISFFGDIFENSPWKIA